MSEEEMKINKILIANRGEIALRVIKTCKDLGIETVTLYALNDRELPHASAGDQNISLGSGSLAETYLNQERIIEIAKETGAQAIHPGYGFLSENTEFCKKVKAAGLIFIGPSVEAIELMGDKKTSKEKMEEIGVPLIPGYHGDDQSITVLKKEAEKIGFPVLIKATAGGGGKGMRIVDGASEFEDARASAKREAKNAFGNDQVLLEKYIVNPRHIEIQLVSDGKGNHFHFFERECSIQRRYQKVVEETPSVALDDELRANMCETAVKIASGINYLGAGTIELILAEDNSFYFLEMNTRLQVEHPVTEMVTGVDLVELQILAASGEAFDFEQSDITQTGHAIEVRIYAEDPDNEFLPTTGKIQQIEVDSEVSFRLDCGYRDGNSISTSYDPMLAKLITWEQDRDLAIESMQDALNSVVFGGTKTNRDYLKRILNHERFVDGDINTHFIAEESEELQKEELHPLHFCIVSLVAELDLTKHVWDSYYVPHIKRFEYEGREVEVLVLKAGSDGVEVKWGSDTQRYSVYSKENNRITLGYKGEVLSAYFYQVDQKGTLQVFIHDFEVKVRALPKVSVKSGVAAFGEGALQSPMPGKIFKIIQTKGKTVSKGQPVLILEAMKMEHTIKANKDGVIKELFFKEGDQVQGGVLLCEIE